MGLLQEDVSSITEQDDINGNYFIMNGKRYDKPDDVFYLKSKDLTSQQKIPDINVIQPYDIVIGANPNAPILVFYGCPTTDNIAFEEFNRNLYMEAMNEEAKIRFIWRSTCSHHGERVEYPLNFPLGITLHNGSCLLYTSRCV